MSTSFNSRVRCSGSFQKRVFVASESLHPCRSNVLQSKYGDAILNDALRAAGLFSLQEGLDEARLILDSNIASGGGNLSVGQRQILALARVIIRESKLLILDEGELGLVFLRTVNYSLWFY